MRRITAIVLAGVLMFILSSCSFISKNGISTKNKEESKITEENIPENNTNENNTAENETNPVIPKDVGFNAEEAAKNFQVTEYKINDKFHYFAVYVVKNTSEVTLDINGNIEAFNGESIIGAEEGGQYAVPPGKEVVLAYSFDESFTETKYKFTAQVSSLYIGVIQDLSFDSNTAKNKEIITVKNNGTHNAEFVQATALFFKNSKLVFLDSTYICNSDVLKPNESKSAEISCYESYDSIQVFLNGRATK